MRVYLITTTIYRPSVLSRYVELAKRSSCPVTFIVAGDRKTPEDTGSWVKENCPDAIYLSPEDQDSYPCSEKLGWDCIMRRNMAILKAIELSNDNSDIVISIDDDNYPLDEDYFDRFINLLTKPYNGLSVRSTAGWFNVGDFFSPKFFHRGFPYGELRETELTYKIQYAQNEKIGIAAGLWFGDPDIDAMARITNRPEVKYMPEVAIKGVIIPSVIHTPTNSQNTAYPIELAPLMAVWPYVGRYDDIWASYMAQHIMQYFGYLVHFGPPFCLQERNPHNLMKNLKDEIHGMTYTPEFIEVLDKIDLSEFTWQFSLNSLLKCIDHCIQELYNYKSNIFQLNRTRLFLESWTQTIRGIKL